MNFKKRATLLLIFIVNLFFLANSKGQYQFQIIVDINQIWPHEFSDAWKLKCDGVWSIPGNSSKNKGRNIPITDWKNCFDLLGQAWICTEDYYQNFPHKNYTLTKDIIPEDSIQLICLYAEPMLEINGHETTVVSNKVIDDAHNMTGKKIIVLSRAYINHKWKENVDRALTNHKVGGICFEQKPNLAVLNRYNIAEGLKVTIEKGKKAFLLLPPNFYDVSTNYTADIETVFNYLKEKAPAVLESENFYFVPNCYNRHKAKTTTLYGGNDSVEGAIKKLKELRQMEI